MWQFQPQCCLTDNNMMFCSIFKCMLTLLLAYVLSIGKYHLKKEGLLKTLKNLLIVFTVLYIAHQEKCLR